MVEIDEAPVVDYGTNVEIGGATHSDSKVVVLSYHIILLRLRVFVRSRRDRVQSEVGKIDNYQDAESVRIPVELPP